MFGHCDVFHFVANPCFDTSHIWSYCHIWSSSCYLARGQERQEEYSTRAPRAIFMEEGIPFLFLVINEVSLLQYLLRKIENLDGVSDAMCLAMVMDGAIIGSDWV